MKDKYAKAVLLMQHFAFSLTIDGMTGRSRRYKQGFLPAANLCVLWGITLNLFAFLPLNWPFKLI